MLNREDFRIAIRLQQTDADRSPTVGATIDRGC
jgi:hypothetical protein